MLGSSRVAAQLAASREMLISMELVFCFFVPTVSNHTDCNVVIICKINYSMKDWFMINYSYAFNDKKFMKSALF
jgi:hypothetical protein